MSFAPSKPKFLRAEAADFPASAWSAPVADANLARARAVSSLTIHEVAVVAEGLRALGSEVCPHEFGSPAETLWEFGRGLSRMLGCPRDAERFVSLEDAVELVGFDVAFLKSALANGSIKGEQHGRKVFVNPAEVARIFAARNRGGRLTK